MIKRIAILLCAILLAGLFTGCTDHTVQTDQIKIVATVFPVYDWVREVLGEEASHADVTLLLDNGVDLHSYQPTADDMIRIKECDLFIYVGGESEHWVEDALPGGTNPDRVVINLLETLGDAAKAEEHVEGMEANEEEDEETAYDEHVWLSLQNAAIFCEAISDALIKIDPSNKDIYTANATDYSKQLMALDEKYRTAVDGAKVRTLLFGDRFPFRYLTDDYGLSYFAAFAGCSAETEASFETVVFLASKADELGINAILKLESSDGALAETIRQSTSEKNQKILSLDSMQSMAASDIKNGETYLSVMQKNLEVLKEAMQ